MAEHVSVCGPLATAEEWAAAELGGTSAARIAAPATGFPSNPRCSGHPAASDWMADVADNEPSAPPYDAFLLVSFGGPEGPDDVIPFLENVTRGRGIPRARLAEVGGALPPLRRGEPDQPAVP